MTHSRAKELIASLYHLTARDKAIVRSVKDSFKRGTELTKAQAWALKNIYYRQRRENRVWVSQGEYLRRIVTAPSGGRSQAVSGYSVY
jgi:hypothetical protein